MLKTVWLTDKQDTCQGVAMLLGGFDGLHLGHRQLLSRAKESGLPVGVMTIVGGKGDESLFTFAERELIFRENGADFVFELPFAEIKDLSANEFLRLLQTEFSPHVFVCGEDFRFGAGAKGDAKTLKGADTVRVEVLPLVEKYGEKVSSKTVKEHLKQGEIEMANVLLGENFFLLGEVIKDRQIGRTLGFPTANVLYPNGKFPLKKGVYETRICVGNDTYRGITNYGARPTFNNSDVLTETYLDVFDGDLYGKTLKIEFVRYLRDIQKFDGVDALKKQLTQDIERVRNND
ncbi:MAG: riboflavin biosynthesis protein RibF [Clostridia bacterium]|nr:riboflavin biosynthesis protein RibF [Clostridia bacterium]